MQKYMKKFLRILYQPYKWLVFIPFLGVTTIFFGFMGALLVFILSPKLSSFLCGTTWARLNGYMTPMLVRVSGRENIDRRQSYIIVTNHQSQYDIFVLYGWLGIDFKWVMKQELRKVPGIGIGCEKVGHIFIDRSHPDRAIASLNAAKDRIINGTSVIFFPEGTRSRDGSLGEFKKGAFKMAVDLGLPILPITIVGTRNILPSNTFDLFPGKVRLIIHRPIEIAGIADNGVQQLMNRSRAAIQSGMG